MNKLIFILLIVVACKKKEVKPEPPAPEPIHVCQGGKVRLEGKFKIESSADTIQFVYMGNDCPREGSNIYLVKNYANATNAVANATLSPAASYTVISYQNDLYCEPRGSKTERFTLKNDTHLILNNDKMKYGSINFYRVK